MRRNLEGSKNARPKEGRRPDSTDGTTAWLRVAAPILLAHERNATAPVLRVDEPAVAGCKVCIVEATDDSHYRAGERGAPGVRTCATRATNARGFRGPAWQDNGTARWAGGSHPGPPAPA